MKFVIKIDVLNRERILIDNVNFTTDMLKTYLFVLLYETVFSTLYAEKAFFNGVKKDNFGDYRKGKLP